MAAWGLRIACLGARTGSGTGQADQKWPVKQFELVETIPWHDDVVVGGSGAAAIARAFGLNPETPTPTNAKLSPELKREVELYLARIAQQFEAWGFPAPDLNPVVQLDDGRLAYRVYYVDLVSGRSRYESNSWILEPLAPSENIIFFHNRNLLQSGRLSQSGKSTLAHELFHAVQGATKLRQDYPGKLGSWIVEGQASAVGYDTERLLAGGNGNLPKDSGRSWWGLRDYSRALPVPRGSGESAPDIAYQTSSFWRYLAELDYSRGHRELDALPGPMPAPYDYRYLNYFLAQTVPEKTLAGEVAWLDGALRNYHRFRFPLNRVYANFIAAYVEYGRYRAETPNFRGSDADALLWVYESFPDCPAETLTPTQRKVSMIVDLAQAATACRGIYAEGFAPEVSADVQLAADSQALLEQLAVVFDGGQRVVVPSSIGVDNAAGKARARWSIRLREKPAAVSIGGFLPNNIFVLNIARIARDTKRQSVELTVSIGGSEVLQSTPGPAEPAAAEQPSREDKRTGKPDEAGPAGAAKAADGRRQRAADKVTSNGPLGQRIERENAEPMMKIHLRSVPDELAVLGEVNGTGGLMEQILASAGVVERAGPAGFVGGVTQAIVDRTESVELRIPRIDYGFTGTFRNAEILLSRPAASTLEARGPVDADPGAFVEFLPSGSITIDEYRPEFLSGTFVGDLIDRSANPVHSRDRVVTAKIERRVQGRFWISSPWQGDDRIEPVLSSGLEADFRSDMLQRLPAELAPVAAGGSFGESSGNQPGESPSSSANSGGCDCSCAAKAQVTATLDAIDDDKGPSGDELQAVGCMMSCMQTYASCPGD